MAKITDVLRSDTAVSIFRGHSLEPRLYDVRKISRHSLQRLNDLIWLLAYRGQIVVRPLRVGENGWLASDPSWKATPLVHK